MSRHLIQDVHWNIRRQGENARPSLVLLHGFAGSMSTWDQVVPDLRSRFRLLLIDLPGHGASDLPKNSTFDFAQLIAGLARLIPAAVRTPALICGYSMGGRIALQLALNCQRLVRGLILIGASPGIEDPHARTERKHSDDNLANQILINGIQWFADYWAKLPIFESQKRLPPAIQDRIRGQRLSCSAEGLAFALRRLGTGVQENLWPRLPELQVPLLLVAGALDHKFQESNLRIRTRVASNIVMNCVVADAGHSVHLEDPPSLIRAIMEFHHTITHVETT